MKKYELIKHESGFFRIKALKDFRNIKKGELGGLIQKESNLSQYNDAWIYSGACVYGNAEVYGNAFVHGNAEVYGSAVVFDSVLIFGKIHERFTKISSILCEERIITIYQDLNGYLKCNIGCQEGMTLEDLLKRIKEDGGMKPHRKQYVNIMKNAKSILNIE